MYLICDENDVIQDLATRKENLSRGFRFANYKLYEDVDFGGSLIVVGDTYRDGKLIVNNEIRQQEAEKATNRGKINDEIRRFAIEALKQRGELPPDYTE